MNTKGVEDGITDVRNRCSCDCHKFVNINKSYGKGVYCMMCKDNHQPVRKDSAVEFMRSLRSATPEELTAQAESYGKNYKPGPIQATPFMPERIGDHINCPKHGLKFGFCEECVESPEELPHMQGNETKAVSDLLNSMKVIDRHQRYQECRSDVLTKLMYELAALRENKPTLPVPERTAEMDEPYETKFRVETVWPDGSISKWDFSSEDSARLDGFAELKSRHNDVTVRILRLETRATELMLDHIEGKPK